MPTVAKAVSLDSVPVDEVVMEAMVTQSSRSRSLQAPRSLLLLSTQSLLLGRRSLSGETVAMVSLVKDPGSETAAPSGDG